jgi:FkbM family methyltransferase
MEANREAPLGVEEGLSVSNLDAVSEAELHKALHRILSSTDHPFVLDVGANDGGFILGLNNLVSVSALCFEPGPAAFDRLTVNLAGQPQIRALQVAIAETEGNVLFHISESDVGSSLLKPVAGQSSKWAKTATQIIVPTVRLDGVLSGDSRFVDLLKVDTQGTDLGVLLSAGQMLNPVKVGAVLIEVNFHRIYEGQNSFADVYRLLVEKGYFLAELFRYYNRKGWLWYADALFLPSSSEYAT